MRVTRLTLRDFRSYATADVRLGPGLTVVSGFNGAGKTNLLEALYFACTGRACRTANERELVRFGAAVTRLELTAQDEHATHTLTVGFQPGEAKRMTVDGATVERLTDSPTRPLVSVFLPDRLELITGAPALRRAHLDQVVAALWPARAQTRRAYSAALAQRNALLASIRAGNASRASLPAWSAELARHGIVLMAQRREAVERLKPSFVEHAADLGLEEDPEVSYRARSRATTVVGLADELGDRVSSDLERGFTGHGPHRDDLVLSRAGRDLRTYGSRGQQRLGLLSLLLAERAALADERGAPPLLLLDDVMSELDVGRRERLVAVLQARGQCVLTTTELAHVPGAEHPGIDQLVVADGSVRQAAPSDQGPETGPASARVSGRSGG
ncbi:MAG: DNA replication/repair protein RecF [Solirubrobacterales bacterium]|nr:DNA replication/repair protein RecF [Solirubrobacterales bacterium]